MALAVVFVADEQTDLVARAHLPRQAHRLVDVKVVLVTGTRRVLRVEQRALRVLQLVEIQSGEIARRDPAARAAVEPQLVASERSAGSELDVIERPEIGRASCRE